MIGSHRKKRTPNSYSEHLEDIEYILVMLWEIPSMVDKLPKHILIRLEGVMEYRDRKGKMFDNGQSG